jgi:hypothetical protein
MFTLAKRVGCALLVGAVALGVAAGDAAAQVAGGQGFRVGTGTVGAGGVGAYKPTVGGFNYSAYATPTNPYGTLLTSPMASMTSTGGSGYDNGYNPYGYGNYTLPDPFSGYLKGTADVINAQGKYLVNTQQAYLMKEQVRATQIENRRRVFDEWLYERANTPSLNDERERIIREEVRRSRNDPPLPEIWSAKALNDLLADAQKLQGRKIQGPNVPLDEEVLKKINLTKGDGSNFGLLKNDGKLNFPLALRGLDGARELREELQVAITKAYNDAKEGKNVDVATIQKIDDNTNKLQNMLVKNVGSVPFSQYSDAKTYLKQLDDAVKVLKKGDAAEFINGNMTPKASNVGELIEFMSRKGLQFAPATGNEQAAYMALHKALVSYDVGANTLAADKER